MSIFGINLLPFKSQLTLRIKEQKQEIFDPIRKRWYLAQPEEIVRQLFILYLKNEKNIPLGKIAVEKGFKVAGLAKRFDLVVLDAYANPLLLIELKSAKIPLNQNVLDQANFYNKTLNCKYSLVSNGLQAVFAEIDYTKNEYFFHNDVLNYEDLR